MHTERRFCGHCGVPLERQRHEERLREVCPACGTVFYRNPLPVAAAVVLDPARRVLLVRRRNEPHRGAWCLPTGFAELDESIEEAALRELAEETGLRGRVARLLDARSTTDEHYGDLLFVSFEVQQEGSEPRPGDDAAELAWFPLDDPPPLAFAPHADALRRCRALHRDEWLIQDSFARLREEGAVPLVSDALVALVEEQAEAISARWLAVVRSSPSTPGYAALPPAQVQAQARAVLSRFCAWLAGAEAGAELAGFYHHLGRERRAQGIGLAELLSAVTLLRREIWDFVEGREALVDLLEVYRALELSRRVVLFFDRALYHAARGHAAGAER